MALISSSTVQAQHWVDLMLDEETNIYDVKAAFEEAWQGRTYERGKGWKQFHRWYWFMEQRTWPDGERMDPATTLELMEELRTLRAQRGVMRDAALWESMGPTTWLSTSYNPGNGRVNVVALDPNDPSIIYAGMPSSGLWRSNDNAATWTPLFTDLPSMGVSGIVVHPGSSDTIFIATGDGDGADTFSAGVLRSSDGGSTWETTGLNWTITQSRTTRALRMDPADPRVMYCAASNGLFRTQDGSDTWEQQLSGSFRDVEFMPGNSNVVYACTDRFYRSTADTVPFSPAGIIGLPPSNEVGRMAIAVTPADPQVVYVLCSKVEDSGFLGLYRSNDAGQSFVTCSTSPNLFDYSTDGSEEGGQAWYDMALAVDPQNPNVVYVGGINVWKSTDGGTTWMIQSHWVFPSTIGYTHADIHSLDIIDGRLFCGSDGGLFVSDNGAASWTDLSAGLDITQFYRMGGSELLPNLVMAGAQDNGTFTFEHDQWTHVYGADGMEAAVDRANPTIRYASSQNGGLIRSNDGGIIWNSMVSNIDEPGSWVTPFVLDPEMPTRIIAGFNNLWVTEDRGDNWYPTTDWSTNQKVRCIAFAPSDANVIYAARNDLVQRCVDGGWTWESIRPGLPNQAPTSIAVDHEDPLHVWITFSGTAASQKVYESTNGGDTWTNRSAGLPNVPVNTVVTQPGSPNGVYIGTDIGVFYRDDHNTDWQVYGTGMPNVVISELEVNMATAKLRAATYGRGIWQADLYQSPFAGIAQHSQSEGPRLVPVDMEGRFSILPDSRAGRVLGVRVLDALGRLIVNEARAVGILDLNARAPGAYSVVIVTEGGTWVRRVVR